MERITRNQKGMYSVLMYPASMSVLENSLRSSYDFDVVLSQPFTSSTSFDIWNKVVDPSPIIDKIIPYVQKGYKVVGYVSSFHFYLKQQLYKIKRLDEMTTISPHDIQYVHNKLTTLNVTEFSSGDVDLQLIKKWIESDIQFNREGRIIAVIYQTHAEQMSGNRNHQFFAYHPNDKDNPILKDIWVDVYK